MQQRLNAISRSNTAYSNFERIVNAIVPLRKEEIESSDSEEEERSLSLATLFQSFTFASLNNLKLELLSESQNSIKADYQLSLSSINLCFRSHPLEEPVLQSETIPFTPECIIMDFTSPFKP